MVGALGVVAFFVVVWLVTHAIIRADKTDQARYDRWFDHPGQVWNGGDGRVPRY